MSTSKSSDEAACATVRKMRTEDLDVVLSVLADANMVPLAPSPDIPEPEVSELVIAHTFVAEVGREIAGVASYFVRSNEVFETGSFAVLRCWRGYGIGYRLQHARLLEMKARGATTVITQTDKPENVEWFVRRFGYRQTDRNMKRHSFGDPDIDHWIVLELNLAAWTPDS